MSDKSEQAYRTIGEVAKILDLKDKKYKSLSTYTIRFWEKEFKQIKPKILKGNRRYYDQKNIDLLKKIKFLLKDKGMTIKGVKKLLNTTQSNELDEISNKFISATNLKYKINKISKIIKELKINK
tara:strand:+ start:1181 stop:1555 length:375 start_codon:yes stop_codon:yes gene_type:complete